MDSNILRFYDPSVSLDEKYSSTINIYKARRGSKKCATVVQNFYPGTEKGSKKFMEIISSTGVSSSYKMMEDYDTQNKVYIFSGDKLIEVIDALTNVFDIDKEFIKCQGW